MLRAGVWHDWTAMTMIPKSIRLPFTFGLSGALHAAVLSNLVVPPPVTYSSTSIQVRLPAPHSARDTGTRLVNISDTRIAPVSNPLPPRSRPAALTRPLRGYAAISPRVERARAEPQIEAQADPATEGASHALDSEHMRHLAASKSAQLSLAETAALVPSAPAPQTYAVETPKDNGATDNGAVNKHATEIGAVKGLPGDVKKTISAEPDGTLDSPFNVPRALYSPLRKYPEEARWERRTGQGSLGFRLKPDGSVDEEIRVLRSSGHADLDATAVESLRHWRFAFPPGAAPSSWYRYPFRFGMS